VCVWCVCVWCVCVWCVCVWCVCVWCVCVWIRYLRRNSALHYLKYRGRSPVRWFCIGKKANSRGYRGPTCRRQHQSTKCESRSNKLVRGIPYFRSMECTCAQRELTVFASGLEITATERRQAGPGQPQRGG